MLVGEIGIPRREFLYDIRFWEVRRIVRGYRRRDRLKHQLIAMCAYNAMFAFRGNEGKRPVDLFPEIFSDDEDDDPTAPSLTAEDVAGLQQLMATMNAKNAMNK